MRDGFFLSISYMRRTRDIGGADKKMYGHKEIWREIH